MPFVSHFAHRRRRLIIALVLGVAIGLALPSEWHLITRALTAWNIGVWAYLLSITGLIARSRHASMVTLAEQEDSSAAAVLAVLSFAAVISIAAIVLELASSRILPVDQRFDHYAFTAVTLLGSWLLLGVIFTFHYAHMFYRAHANKRPLAFPDRETNPDYWDFLYFSFTIAVAAQTSDVIIMSRAMRKVVLAQSVLSFIFNVAVLGLSINIAAGLVGS